MPLWDDATAPYTGQQGSDNSSLWGWLTSLFSGRQPQAQQPQTAPSTQVYTGPQVNPSLYPGSTSTSGNWTSGPASLRYAPPSLYTAADPQQQARWNQASTPQGWAALAAQAANAPAVGGGGGVAPAPTAASSPATMVRPSTPPYYPAGGMLPSGAAPVVAPPSPYGVPPYGPQQFNLTTGAPGLVSGLPGSPSGSGLRRSTLTMAPTQPAPLGDITQMTSAQIEAIPDSVYNNLTEAQRTQLMQRWMALNPNR